MQRREVIALIAAGVFVMVVFGDWGRYTVDQVLPFVVAAGLLLVTPLTRGLTNALERVRHPGRRGAAIGAGVVTLIALAVLVGVPLARGYELIPRSHDEHMHLLQAQMLARGRLWMPPHPHADFFETFFVLARPVYASIYFPGASLLFAPGVWLGLPYWFMPALISAAAVGLMYLAISEAVDGVAGLLAAMLLLASSMFREVALLPMSHNVMLALALAATYAWLRWRRAAQQEWGVGSGEWGVENKTAAPSPPAPDSPPPTASSSSKRAVTQWAALAGAAAGLAAITRPLDALCYALPLVLASLPTLFRMPRGAAAKTIGVAAVAALPFLALQLALNVGTTGRLLGTPYALYLESQQPGTTYGFHDVPREVVPASQLPQKHLYYEEFHRPAVQRHRPATVCTTFLRERVPLLLMTTVAHPFLLLVLPLALLGLRALRDRVPAAAMLATLATLALGYAFNALLLSHYLVVWMPPMILLIVLAPLALARAFPRLAGILPAAAVVMLLAAVISAQPGVNPHAQKQWTAPQMSEVHRALATLPHKPAVVLFRFDPQTNFHHEPVYNVETAWPDDAEVIRAHDLGERNAELIRYYAGREPERWFYVYERSTGAVRELGAARELVKETGGE